jgi:microcystin-dependent protein
MALETGTYISDLVSSNPPSSDSLAQAAGHLRLIKSTILATFPNVEGEITATDTEINAAMTTAIAGQYVPAGVVNPYAGSSAPTGYLLCYGQAVSRTTYSGLFSAISTNFGTGDGSTTFNVPDLRDRVIFGKGNMGGSDAGIIDSLLTSTTLGATYDGEGAIDTITLTTSHLPAHTHSFSDSGTTGSANIDHNHTAGSLTTTSGGSHDHEYTNRTGLVANLMNGGNNDNMWQGSSTSNAETSSGGTHSHDIGGETSLMSSAGYDTTHEHSFSVSGTTGSAGSGNSFTVAILNPSIVLNFIIKT